MPNSAATPDLIASDLAIRDADHRWGWAITQKRWIDRMNCELGDRLVAGPETPAQVDAAIQAIERSRASLEYIADRLRAYRHLMRS